MAHVSTTSDTTSSDTASSGARRRPRRSTLLAVTAVVALTGLASACSGAAASAERTSAPRPAAPVDELPPPDELPPGAPGEPGELPDLGDLEDELDDLTEGLGQAGECATLGLAYAELLFVAFTSENAGSDISDVVDELRDRAPADLQDDLDVIEDTLVEASEAGILDATGALSDPAFAEANDALSQWLATECGG
jgi:hypothetical protein